MRTDRGALVALATSLPDDAVPIALEFLRGLFIGGEARHAADHIAEWQRWRQALTWPCHACGDERPDALISVATETFTAPGGGQGQVNRRYCNDRPVCEAVARVQATEMADRIANAGG